MAATPSTMTALGTQAPDFALPDPAADTTVSLEEVRGEKGTLVMFICNHCPYVKHLADELARLGEEYIPTGIGMAAINSNDAETYPQDGPEQMAEESRRRGYPFPYLFDASQNTARQYAAACTPDFFLFDSDLVLVYRGQFDDSRPGNDIPVTGKDIRAAMDQLLSGELPDEDQKPSIGCGIKWKTG